MLAAMTTAPARRSAAEQARLDAALTTLFEQQISFNQVLGLKIGAGPLPSRSLPLGGQRSREAASLGAQGFTGQGASGPTLRFDMRPELVGHHLYGRLHGGVISATLDAMGGLAVMWAIAEKHADEAAAQVMQRFAKLGTIDLRVDYLRPGLGRHFVAHAEVMRLGGRVGTTQMRLVNDEGTLIATAAAAYIVS
jgi:uncharacterized protein (TIGR00369 family)